MNKKLVRIIEKRSTGTWIVSQVTWQIIGQDQVCFFVIIDVEKPLDVRTFTGKGYIYFYVTQYDHRKKDQFVIGENSFYYVEFHFA